MEQRNRKEIRKNAAEVGYFDNYSESTSDKKRRANVDNDRLAMIENWRTLLAEDIALHNSEMDATELTDAVGKIINRILFLRICEDKEIEPAQQLHTVAESKIDIYAQLQKLFVRATDKFNTELFAIDVWLNNLDISDKTLTSIIASLYSPPFSMLPIDILGLIHERFLGQLVRFTRKTKNKLSIEILEGPVFQKKGGVYYTPPHIVNYIVQNTIGKKIEKKTPENISKMHFLDPACGSGNFLVGAYQYLLDYHLNYYNSDLNRTHAEKNRIIYKNAQTEEYQLSVETKRQILFNNIYGVDIDARAVEVTKLTLFLMLFENGNYYKKESLSSYSDASITHIFSSLSNHIKCGNSLISIDFYKDKNIYSLDREAQHQVNAFDWEKEFPFLRNEETEVAASESSPTTEKCDHSFPSNRSKNFIGNRGFDCVIGNPPYVFARDSHEKGMEKLIKHYYYKHYDLAKYQINLYHLFIERGAKLLKYNGLFGYIIPNNWLTINSNKHLRDFILNQSEISILNFKYKVFPCANVDTCALTFCNGTKSGKIALFESTEAEKYDLIVSTKVNEIKKQKNSVINIDRYKNSIFSEILAKMESKSTALSTISQIKAGLKAYEIGKGIPKQTKEMKDNRIYHTEAKVDDSYFPYLRGNDVKRYQISWDKKEYLKYGKNLAAPRATFDLFSTPRILVRQIPSPLPYCINACYTTDIFLNDLNSMNIIHIQENPKYVLSVLNSLAISFWFEQKFGKLSRGIFPQFKLNELAMFPIPVASTEQQQKLAALIDRMIATHKQLAAVVGETKRKLIQQRIESIDKHINTMVYQLYGLTKKEVKIIEEHNKNIMF